MAIKYKLEVKTLVYVYLELWFIHFIFVTLIAKFKNQRIIYVDQLFMMYAQICIPSYLNTYNEHTLYEKFVCCEVSNKRMIKLLIESKHS